MDGISGIFPYLFRVFRGFPPRSRLVASKEPRPNCNQAVLDVRCTKEGGKMMFILKMSLLAVIAPLCWGALVKTESPEKVPYPEGYRRWTHVRTGSPGPESPDSRLTAGRTPISPNAK